MQTGWVLQLWFPEISQWTVCSVHSSPWSKWGPSHPLPNEERWFSLLLSSPLHGFTIQPPTQWPLWKKKKKVYFWGRKVCHMLIIKPSINVIHNWILLGLPFINCWECNHKCLYWIKHSKDIHWHFLWLIQWSITTKMAGLPEHSERVELNPMILLTLEEIAFYTTENWSWAHVDLLLKYKI